MGSASAVEKGHIPHAWSFNPSSLEARAGGGIKAIDAAILALVARHNTQIVNRNAAASAARTFSGGSYHAPSTHTTTRIRVRR